MKLRVVRKEAIAADTLRVGFEAYDGTTLPAFKPGAHIELCFAGFTRHYSLTSSPEQTGRYEICVLRTTASRGGSAYLHDRLNVGELVEAVGPHNAFPLNTQASHSVFIAGGIGVTPFITMMDALERKGASFELHYAVRSRDRVLPIPAHMGNAVVYASGEDRPRLDVRGLLVSLDTASDLYVCGPRGLIDAVRQTAAALGWPSARVHVESFGAAPQSTDRPVTVKLVLSGTEFTVAPGTTLLDALLAHGIWVPYECQRGECATCMTEVLAGNPDHRDVCLTPGQRKNHLCVCVSWSESPELVLNL